MSANPVYKWFSALLCYPEAELIEVLPEFQTALKEWPELQSQAGRLKSFLDYLGSHNLRELQENYVATFDRNRNHALYIFEHVYGEDRDRGSAMVDLLQEYRNHGFELGDEELPDYLPALLEYLSQVPSEHAQKLLGDTHARCPLLYRSSLQRHQNRSRIFRLWRNGEIRRYLACTETRYRRGFSNGDGSCHPERVPSRQPLPLLYRLCSPLNRHADVGSLGCRQ